MYVKAVPGKDAGRQKSAKDKQDNEKLLPASNLLLAISKPVLLVAGVCERCGPDVGRQYLGSFSTPEDSVLQPECTGLGERPDSRNKC